MRLLHEIDRKDYNPSSKGGTKHSCRAIIRTELGYAMIFMASHGLYTFPGGRIESGESPEATLAREALEEAGLVIINDSIKEFGMAREKRKDLYGKAAFEQYDYYFLCKANDERHEPSLSPGEVRAGYELRFVKLSDAIAQNEKRVSEGLYWAEPMLSVMKIIYKELGD